MVETCAFAVPAAASIANAIIAAGILDFLIVSPSEGPDSTVPTVPTVPTVRTATPSYVLSVVSQDSSVDGFLCCCSI
jgi:hypothetical protein